MIEEHSSGARSGRAHSRRKRSVAIYLATLFCAAMLLLVLAYFMQERAIAYYGMQLVGGIR